MNQNYWDFDEDVIIQKTVTKKFKLSLVFVFEKNHPASNINLDAGFHRELQSIQHRGGSCASQTQARKMQKKIRNRQNKMQ